MKQSFCHQLQFTNFFERYYFAVHERCFKVMFYIWKTTRRKILKILRYTTIDGVTRIKYFQNGRTSDYTLLTETLTILL